MRNVEPYYQSKAATATITTNLTTTTATNPLSPRTTNASVCQDGKLGRLVAERAVKFEAESRRMNTEAERIELEKTHVEKDWTHLEV